MTSSSLQRPNELLFEEGIERHPEYYIDDGNLIILIENCLFKVHRSTLTRHSRVFQDVFSLPPANAGHAKEAEGASDDDPVHIPGILKVDFERLLWILYPPNFGEHRATTADEWKSILHLATRWEFDDVRLLAIRRIEQASLGVIDKILLSKEYNINSRWALKAYIQLCTRPLPLTLEEASTLGMGTSVKVAQLRERLLCPRSTSPPPKCGPWRLDTGRPASASPISAQGNNLALGSTWIDCRRQSSMGPGYAHATSTPRHKSAASRPLTPSARLVAETFGMLETK